MNLGGPEEGHWIYWDRGKGEEREGREGERGGGRKERGRRKGLLALTRLF